MTKELFLIFLSLFQRFIMLLTEHLVRCETSGVDINTTWYKNCIERLQQIFLMVVLIHLFADLYCVFSGHITALINCLQSSLSPTASCDHPAVYGHPGEPAVHRWARPSHPGCLPAVLCSSALRSHNASLQTVTPACLVTSIGIIGDGLL